MATEELPIYYINLDSSTQRRASIEAQMKAAGLSDAIRVPAFDGRTVDLKTATDCDLPEALRYMGRPLRGGEYGCYRSHLDCLERFLASGREHAVVFEDDADIDPAFAEITRQALRVLTTGDRPWDVVHLGASHLKIQSPVAPLDGKRKLLRAYYFPMLANALLWSRDGARKFVEHHSRIAMPVDNQFRKFMTDSGYGYAVWPPVVRTIMTPSDIDGSGTKRQLEDRLWNYGWLKQRRSWKTKLVARYRRTVEKA